MVVCLVQCDPTLGQENVRALPQLMAGYPADIYVLPELFTTGFQETVKAWPKGAESIPQGATCTRISSYLWSESRSAVICGILEREGDNYYNTAVVIGRGVLDRYRQKYPARDTTGRIFPVIPGEFKMVWLGPHEYGYRARFGLMSCHDHFAAGEFFRHYSEAKADGVVMIADSLSRDWIEKFPRLCGQYGLLAVICNAAGSGKGSSCIIDRQGKFVALRTRLAQYESLPDFPVIATASLEI